MKVSFLDSLSLAHPNLPQTLSSYKGHTMETERIKMQIRVNYPFLDCSWEFIIMYRRKRIAFLFSNRRKSLLSNWSLPTYSSTFPPKPKAMPREYKLRRFQVGVRMWLKRTLLSFVSVCLAPHVTVWCKECMPTTRLVSTSARFAPQPTLLLNWPMVTTTMTNGNVTRGVTL